MIESLQPLFGAQTVGNPSAVGRRPVGNPRPVTQAMGPLRIDRRRVPRGFGETKFLERTWALQLGPPERLEEVGTLFSGVYVSWEWTKSL